MKAANDLFASAGAAGPKELSGSLQSEAGIAVSPRQGPVMAVCGSSPRRNSPCHACSFTPPHCANLTNAALSEMGIAFAVNPKSKMGVYWAQAFGTPR